MSRPGRSTKCNPPRSSLSATRENPSRGWCRLPGPVAGKMENRSDGVRAVRSTGFSRAGYDSRSADPRLKAVLRTNEIPNPKSQIRNLVWCLPLLLAGFCFWRALPSTDRPSSATAVASAPAVPQIASSRRTLITRPIQDIEVGQRVLADNPELAGQDVPQADFDPETTRLVVLHQVKPDGHELTVETLLPVEALFVAALERLTSDEEAAIEPLPVVGCEEDVFLHQSLVGHTLELNLPELGADGPAQITADRHCPASEPDDGAGRRLVTSVFRHAAANVVELFTSDSHDPIGVTENHPFWSEDRQEFIPAGELRPGERLRKADGSFAQVTDIVPRQGPPVPVFNFEVDGQHVYFVGVDGLLVHNTCALNISNTVVSFPKEHHIASIYDDRFAGLFKQAGIGMNSAFNKVKIIGHEGPHGWYYDYVFDRLSQATIGKAGASLRRGLVDELLNLRWELKNTNLGDLVKAAAP
jgi:hypothetical protein